MRQQFGHERFRGGQERAIRALLAGRDVLAILPTGAGKSLIYQIAAQLLPGATVVVSPLIALMKDQEEALEERGVGVAVVDSTRDEDAAAAEMEKLAQAAAKLLYVTPERFDDEAFLQALRRTRVSLLVVDEAHCIAEWGHDFRPAYLSLGAVAEQLGRPTLLALTATATPWIRAEIIERLGMRQPDVIVQGNDRPNLFLEARRVDSEAERRRVLERLLLGDGATDPDGDLPLADDLRAAMQGSGIIYTATTRAAREVAAWLQANGVAADFYHGQRRAADRARVQEQFMRGELRVIAATNAFGLGVDKPDIRFVIHRDIPPSLEAYYQEAGRAGRDGGLARCVLIYRPTDLGRAAFLAGGGQLTRDEVQRARDGLRRHPAGTLRELQAATGLGRGDLARLLELLKQQGIVTARRGRYQLAAPDFDPDAIPLEAEERRRAYERSRLEMMRSYAELRECRRRYILNYFGEEYPRARCGHCDNDRRCSPRAPAPSGSAHAAAGPFQLNQPVVHRSWGEGIVQRVTADSVTVLFERVGYKTFDTAIVSERGILQPRAD